MANLREIRKRIKSVKKTQKLTSAMKMVASARLRRIEPRLIASRDYHTSVSRSIERLFFEYPLTPERFPLMQAHPEVNTVGIIVISGERGLCGAYNSSVVNAAEHFIRERPGSKVVAIGKKSVLYSEKHRFNLIRKDSEILDRIDYMDSDEILRFIIGRYLHGEVQEWYILYHTFVSMLTQRLTLEKLLPVSAPESVAKTAYDYIAEPEPEDMLEKLLPQKISACFYQAVMESVASEQGARRNAMEAASDNAAEMIEKLTLLYNRKRQSAITTEILEVVAGAENQ